ncbi:hypothetical protein [Viridibacillus arvi]|uniref:hypothetical protein n=1 Tax=Viridibacillus arvi TaxID=263475 RepID=UPI003D26963D
MNNILKNEIYYFNNKRIEIIDKFPSFNLAIVRYFDTLEEFSVDINFISSTFSNEFYLTYKI